jgi:hypothetical protein
VLSLRLRARTPGRQSPATGTTLLLAFPLGYCLLVYQPKKLHDLREDHLKA